MSDEKDEEKSVNYKYVLIIIVLVFLFFLSRNKYTKKYIYKLINIEKSLKKYGLLGIILYIIIGILLNIFLVMYFVVNIITGFIFGFKKGILIAYIIVVLSAIISFLISRYYLKDTIINKVEKNDRFKKIIDNQDNYNVIDWLRNIIISRLLPIPFIACNSFWGITNVKLYIYIIGTMIGVIPWLIFEVYVGSISKNIKKYI